MFTRTTLWITATLLATCAALTLTSPAPAEPDAKKETASPAPRVEVVFCLDTTGSMKGLLDRAKEKIWSISNSIAGAKPSPELKIGLVAFRDRGDDYVTKVFDLTDDLDEIHARLKEFKAAGGGDIPESVNEALDVAINKIKWSKDDDTLRILFLVGDAPPHMDYPDDVKYPVTCKKACEKGIVINTIQCGNDTECTKFWQDISRKAEGSYVQISQEGGARTVVATPFDKDLAEINGKLASSTLVYGSKAEQAKGKDSADEARKLAPAAAADRAGFNAKQNKNAAYDLLDAVKSGKVELEKMKKEDLPEELQGKTLQEQKDYLDKLDKERTELRKKALELDKQRTEYINKELAKDKKESSFDGQVLEILRKQGKKAKLDFESK
jgi:Mg-chelatase subunit ChlD